MMTLFLLDTLLELLYLEQAAFHQDQQKHIAQSGTAMADTFCLLLTQWRWTRNSLLLCLDWGTKIVFVRWGKVLPLFRKRCQLEGRREKDFYNFMYSGLLQDKDLILYQLLKMVVHALLALPIQVLAVELEDQCSAAKPLLMRLFFFNYYVTFDESVPFWGWGE